MLQVYVSDVLSISDVCCKCFIWMLHMLQWLYTYVASVYSKCFIYFHTYVVNVLSNVAYVAVAIHICCRRILQMFHLFQTYVAEVFHVATLAGTGSGRMRRRSPRPQWSPRVRQAKQAWVVPIYMRISWHEASIRGHEEHNCMRGWVCRRSSCMRGQMCRRNMWGQTCMRGRLSSMCDRRDGRRKRGRG